MEAVLFVRLFFLEPIPSFAAIFYFTVFRKRISAATGASLLLSWNKRSKSSRLAISKLKNYLGFHSAYQALTLRVQLQIRCHSNLRCFFTFVICFASSPSARVMPRQSGSHYFIFGFLQSAKNSFKNVLKNWTISPFQANKVFSITDIVLVRLAHWLRRRAPAFEDS